MDLPTMDGYTWYNVTTGTMRGFFHVSKPDAEILSSGLLPIAGVDWHNKENDPAIIMSTGEILYYVNNNLHRTNGPAIINVKDSLINKFKHRWYYNGRSYTGKMEDWAIDLDIDLDNPTEEDIIMINITWFS